MLFVYVIEQPSPQLSVTVASRITRSEFSAIIFSVSACNPATEIVSLETAAVQEPGAYPHDSQTDLSVLCQKCQTAYISRHLMVPVLGA
jgi:hypothetical protein